MPLETRHEDTGLLLEHRGQLVLERDEGGTWRLDAGRKAWKLLGLRVRIVGIRSGFDLLDVKKVEPI